MSNCDENKTLLGNEIKGRPGPVQILNNNDKREKIIDEDEKASSDNKTEGPDGGWGWVVVLGSFISTCVLDGICNTFGVMMDPLVKDLGQDRVSVSTVGSVQIAVYFFTGPLAASLVTRYGARPVSICGSILASSGLLWASFSSSLPSLMFGYSLITGLGFGLMYIPAVVAVAHYFTRRRALATSICVCGTGAGTFVMPPLVQFLLDNYGWRWTFGCLSCLCLACILCGAVMVPIPAPAVEPGEDTANHSQGTRRKKTFLQRVFCFVVSEDLVMSSRFGLFLVALTGDFLATMALYIPYTHLPKLAESRGVPAAQAAFLISAAGVSNTLGRVLSGWISDKQWIHPLHLTMAVTSIATIPILILPWCSVYWTFLAMSSLFGLLTGCWVAAESPLIVSLLGLELLTPGFGLLTAGGGLAALAGPPLAGVAVDLGSPGMALVMSGCVMAAAGGSYGVATWRKYRYTRRELYLEI